MDLDLIPSNDNDSEKLIRKDLKGSGRRIIEGYIQISVGQLRTHAPKTAASTDGFPAEIRSRHLHDNINKHYR
jgi:hypothetical protein